LFVSFDNCSISKQANKHNKQTQQTNKRKKKKTKTFLHDKKKKHDKNAPTSDKSQSNINNKHNNVGKDFNIVMYKCCQQQQTTNQCENNAKRKRNENGQIAPSQRNSD
jgi:hypothetical protein